MIGAALVAGFAGGMLAAHYGAKLRRRIARTVRRWTR